FGPPGAATAATLTEEDIEVVEKVSGVEEVTYYIMGNAKIEFKDTIKFKMMIGVEPDGMDIAFGSYGLDEGRFLKNSDAGKNKIMVGAQYKYNDYMGKPMGLGDKMLVNDVEFELVGIVEPIGSPPDDQQIYMANEDFRELFNIPERVDYIVVQVSDQNELNNVADRVEKKLMRARDVDEDTLDFTILTPEELLAIFGTVLSIVTFFLFGIASISLIVGGVNIANAMFTSVLERTKEIGVMKAIGAQNKDILTIFLIEAGLLGLVGGILGVAAGMGIAKAIEYVAVNQLAAGGLLKVIFPYYLIFACLAFAFLVGSVSGLWPAWRATKIKPVDALRYE
ncbi:MAG: FtsX-like permease family protein, partial [Nanoarchaeota archaeon]|nr:FtsX-like permease family protein [Nanoarchaeota archaeon]